MASDGDFFEIDSDAENGAETGDLQQRTGGARPFSGGFQVSESVIPNQNERGAPHSNSFPAQPDTNVISVGAQAESKTANIAWGDKGNKVTPKKER